MKRRLLSIIFLLACTHIVFAQTTVTFDADPKTAGGVTFDLSGDASVSSGSYYFPMGVNQSKTATISISQYINISSLNFSYGTNVQGGYVDFYDGATRVHRIAWPVGGGVVNVSVGKINQIKLVSEGLSNGGLGQLRTITFAPTVGGLATVATADAYDVTATTAKLGGDVTNDGQNTISERGVVYSTTSNPTIGAGTKVSMGSGIGAYTQNVAGLNYSTTYYARAYATNLWGVAYGTETSFQTGEQTEFIIDNAIGTSFDQQDSYPNEPSLYVGYEETFGNSTAALRFTLPSLSKPVINAKLRLYVNSFNSGAFVDVWQSPNESWPETTSTVPEKGTSKLATENITKVDWIEIDVTTYVLTQSTGSREVSLVLTGSTSGNASVYFNSDDATNNKPQLVVSTGSASNNAELSGIVLSSGTLSPAFTSTTSSYTASVSSGTASITVTPTKADANASITVNGNTVNSGSPSANIALNEGNNSITIVVTAQDGVTKKTYTVTVTRNFNAAPTDIALSATSINENVAAGTTVGTLSATDAEGGSMIYTLVSGTGSTDNHLFSISGNSLKLTPSPDYETKSSYSIRLRVTDPGNLTFEKQFSISVTNTNDAPTLAGGPYTFPTITIGTTASAEVLVSDLLAGLTYNDQDAGALKGIIVTGVSEAGHWQFKDGAGNGDWINAPSRPVSATNGVLLSATDRIFYTPDGVAETATITFRAWDQTAHTPASVPGNVKLADPGTNGGTTSFSSGTATASIVVNENPQTITFSALSNATYGDPNITLGGTASSGLAVSYTSSDAAIASVSGNIVTIHKAGSVTITAKQAGNATYAAAADVPRTLTINPKALTITANNAAKTYGQTLTGATGSVNFTPSGLVGSETVGSVTIAYGTGAAATAAVGTFTGTVTPSAASGGTFNASNYSITYVAGNIVVNQAPLTITANNAIKTYGAVLTGASGSTNFSSAGLKNGETIGSVTLAYGTGSAATAAVATYAGQVTPSAATGGTFTASNYSISYANGAVIVNPAPLTITANGVNKTYGQTLTGGSGSTAFSSAGLKNDDTIGSVTIAYGTGAASTDGAGLYALQVTPSSATGGTFTASNYSITYNKGDIVVGKTGQTITFNTLAAKTYGDGSFALSATATSGLAVSFTSSDASVASVSGNTVTIHRAGVATISAKQSGDSNYDPAVDVTQALTIAQKALTITANDATKTYGQTLTGAAGSVSFTPSGLVGSETIGSVTIAYGTGSAATAAVGTFTGSVTPSAATGGTFNADNYSITYVAGNIVVDPAPLTVTANPATKTYGQVLTGVSGSTDFTPAGLQNGETIGSVTLAYGTGSAATAQVGTYAGEVTPGAATGGTFTASNYTIIYAKGAIEVTPASLTITANDVNKTYGQTITGGSSSTAFSSAGLKNGETIGSVTITYGTGSASGDATGLYALQVTPSLATGGTFTASNYNITYQKGDIIVGKSSQTITFNTLPAKTYGDGSFALSATATSGLAVSFTSSDASVASVSGNVVTIHKAGSVVITAGQPGSSNYDAAADVTQGLTINQRPLTITAVAKTKTYGEADPALTFNVTSGSLVGTDVFTGSLTRQPGEIVSAYAINQGTLALSGNYNLSYIGAELTISKKALTVTADDQSKVYGSANPALTVSYSGLVNGETSLPVAPTVSTAVTGSTGVGTYDINVTGTSDNYAITFVKGTLTVTKAPLTIKAENKQKFVGTANPTFTASYNGFVNGDDNTVLTSQPVLSTTATTASLLGDYPITVSNAAADNYAITYVNGTLKVVPGAPTSVALAGVTLYENRPAGTLAGILSSTSDDPAATFTYSLVSGTGDTDNASFKIDGDKLQTAASLNFEAKNSYSIRVRSTTQHGFSLDQVFTVALSDVNEVPTLAAIADETICYTTAPMSVQMSGATAGPETHQTINYAVSSDNAELFEQLSINASGKLTYQVKNGSSGKAVVTVTVKDNGGTANGGVDTFSRTFVITVNPLPVITIASDKGQSISKGDVVRLTATGGATYSWTNPGGVISGQQSATVVFRPEKTATYRVTVTTATGCVENREITIEVKEDYVMLNQTNIVTPNGDGVNDNFVIKNIDMYPNNTVKIFDRGGRLLYSKVNYANDWNGTFEGSPLAEGTYYYIVDFGASKPVLKGFITIVRD